MAYGNTEREPLWERLGAEPFDLLVVGGGINGAGIFRDAALRGLKVALVEMDDFASGTSSRSSKLVHGGLRYLENLEFGLVHESTTERTKLESLAAHVVRPLPFLMPVWKGQKHGLWFMNLGLWVYDALRWFRGSPVHSRLSAAGVLAKAPVARGDGLTGGLLYYDAVTDDTRLTTENVLGGVAAGGVALNRVKAEGATCESGRVRGVTVRDLRTGRTALVRTAAVIVAAGPWTEGTDQALDVKDGPHLRPTKGTHVVVPFDKAPLQTAIVMLAPQDGRACFIIPWHGATVIGTTDTDHPSGDPAQVRATRADAEYLLAAARHHFPGITAREEDIIGTWAGLRPLVREEGVSESKVSREHTIHVDPRGIVTIAGGKLTTYRLIAKECLQKTAAFLPGPLPKSVTGHTPLPYRGDLSDDRSREAAIAALKSGRGLDEDVARHLVHTYGGKAGELLDLARDDARLAERLDPAWPYLAAEVAWACRHEMALTLEDALARRTLIFFLVGERIEAVARKAAAVMAAELGWDPATAEAEVAEVVRLQGLHLACVRPAATPA